MCQNLLVFFKKLCFLSTASIVSSKDLIIHLHHYCKAKTLLFCLVCLWYRCRWYLYSPYLLLVIWTFHFITSRCIKHHGNPLLLCPNLQQVGGVCLSPTRGIHFNLLYTWKHIKITLDLDIFKMHYFLKL